jgi:hypothetical protein
MKSIFRSRTFWLNALLLFIALCDVLRGSPLLAQYGEYLLLASAIANIVLRMLTHQGVLVPQLSRRGARIYDQHMRERTDEHAA